MSLRMASTSSSDGGVERSSARALFALRLIAASGVRTSWAIAAVAASTLINRVARSRRNNENALARREYSKVISVGITLSSMKLAISAKLRAAYQPSENLTELASAATRKFGNHATNTTISQTSRMVRRRANSTARTVAYQSSR